MKKETYLILAILVLCVLDVQAQNYNKIMGKAVKKAIGIDLKGYKVFSYPTNNFGLITSYENSAIDDNFLCDMWNCIGVSDPAEGTNNWLDLNNFAGVGQGGSINLSESKKKKVAVKVILPKIYDVVGVNGGFDKNRTTNINITIGTAYLRKLRRDPIIEYINSLDNTKSIKRAYDNGSLVLAVADCVIEDLSVTVKVDDSTAIGLDTKLGITGSSLASKVFQDATLSVKVEKITNGTYSFRVSHPVIFARLLKKQPSAGTLGANEDFSDWSIVPSINDPSEPN